MNKVLLISFYYPPLADVGARRIARFATYLPSYDWEPHVLTVKNPDQTYCTIGNEVQPSNIGVTRVFSPLNTYSLIGKLNAALYRIEDRLLLSRHSTALQHSLSIPDSVPGWLPMAYLFGKRLIRNKRFDLIFASIKPLGAAILAYILSKSSSIPFIVDARDPISCKALKGRSPVSFQDRFTLKWEQRIVEKCAKYLLTTKTTERVYKHLYPQFSRKFNTIYNGFDPVNSIVKAQLLFPNKFVTIYIGNFYTAELDPSPFFQAIKSLLDEDKDFGSNFIFLYLGKSDYYLEELVRRYRLQGIVELMGLKTRDETIAYVRSSDLFFVRTQFPTNISAKLFDGLAIDIPILSTHTHPEVEWLIRKYAADYSIIYGESVTELKAVLKMHYRRGKSPGLRPFNKRFISEFSPQILTSQLCSVFENVTLYPVCQ